MAKFTSRLNKTFSVCKPFTADSDTCPDDKDVYMLTAQMDVYCDKLLI